MDIVVICIVVSSFLLTALKYCLDYMKDSLNIDVIPARSSNYLVDGKSSYNDITFISFTKLPISIIDVESDVKNEVSEQKTFKPMRCKDKSYSTLSTLGPYESIGCTFLLEEYLVIWEWDVTIRVTTSKGIYIKPAITKSRAKHRELEL